MSDPLYRRVIVKLSGEALCGDDDFGINQPTVERLAADLVATAKRGIELGVVVGGGNIFSGVEVSERGVPRPGGDTMGTRHVRWGGFSRAAAHCTKPRYDPPIMPTFPVDQGCDAHHSTES